MLEINAEHAKRFNSFVDKSGDCWVWTGCKDKDGYGFFRHQHKNLKAHRVAAHLAGMAIDGLMVCHSCDNPSCCNPAHLFTGTNSDNQRDAVRKGRSDGWHGLAFRGESHGKAKLSRLEVNIIRLTYLPRVVTAPMLAAKFGVGESQIRKIVRGAQWA